MEGILSIFTYMGGISLYLVIMSLVTNFIYSSLKGGSKDDKMLLAILGGIFFPIVIPVGIFIYWIYVIVSIPINKIDEDSHKEVKDSKEETKRKFKVGDKITGVKGNPRRYKVLYEGCICRVLGIDRNNYMKIVLIDHEDNEAHSHRFGNTYNAPARNFRLIEKTVTKKNK